MTREEHEAKCEVEARELFTWLEGYTDALGARTPTSSDAMKVRERFDYVYQQWLDRGRRI